MPWYTNGFFFFQKRKKLVGRAACNECRVWIRRRTRISVAVVLPYVAKTAGVPLRFEHEMATSVFACSWAVPPSGVGGKGTDEEGPENGASVY